MRMVGQHVYRWPCWTPTKVNAHVNNSNDWWVYLSLSIVWFHCIHCFSYSYSLICVCLFVSLFNTPLSTTTTLTRPLSTFLSPCRRLSLQVQLEHHSSSKNYNQNAIRQLQLQSWYADNNTVASGCRPEIATWDRRSTSNTPSSTWMYRK